MRSVLFITNYPSPYRVDFFNELGKSCKLTVLFYDNVEDQTHRDKRWFNTNYDNFEVVFLKQQKFAGLEICFDVIDWIKKGFDYVIIGTYSALTAQLAIMYMNMKGICFGLEIDGGIPKNGKGIKEWWKKRLISSASFYFSPSSSSDEYLKFYGANENKILRYKFTSLKSEDVDKVILSSKDKNVYKEKLKIKEDYMVLTVGQFIHRKANDVLIKASTLIERQNVGVYIVGGKPTQQYLDLVNKIGAHRIHFVDFKTKDELANYYRAADLFVLPTREDIWGLVINEAMAKGLPIISTDKCVAALELVEDGYNGYIVRVDDEKQMANKMNTVLGDEDLRKKMSQNSLDKISGYTIENMVKEHVRFFG